jgi:hypothetical protein
VPCKPPYIIIDLNGSIAIGPVGWIGRVALRQCKYRELTHAKKTEK